MQYHLVLCGTLIGRSPVISLKLGQITVHTQARSTFFAIVDVGKLRRDGCLRHCRFYRGLAVWGLSMLLEIAYERSGNGD